MIFLETSIFTKLVTNLLTDEEYRQLQCYLLTQPNAGKVMPGCGGLRKIRSGMTGRGKRGGTRVIYYWASGRDLIMMLLIYPKCQMIDLNQAQKRKLIAIVKEELHER
jgi:hypothetical protein